MPNIAPPPSQFYFSRFFSAAEEYFRNSTSKRKPQFLVLHFSGSWIMKNYILTDPT